MARWPDEQPIVAGTVRLLHMTSGFPKRVQFARTDGQGRFCFPSCGPENDKILALLESATLGAPASAFAAEVLPGEEPILLIPSATSRGRIRARFHLTCEDPGTFPTLIAFFSNAEGAMRWVAPRGETFEIELVPSSYEVMALVPEIGSYRFRRVEVPEDPSVVTELVLPAPGWLDIGPDFVGGLGWEDLSMKLRTSSFGDVTTKTSNPRIDGRRQGGRVRLALFPGPYDVNVLIRGARHGTHEFEVTSGAITELTFRVAPIVLVTLELQLDGCLEKGEGLELGAQGPSGLRKLNLGRVQRLTTAPRFEIGLEPDVRRLEVSSRWGRGGTLDVAPGGVFPGAVLSLPVVRQGPR